MDSTRSGNAGPFPNLAVGYVVMPKQAEKRRTEITLCLQMISAWITGAAPDWVLIGSDGTQ